MESQLSNIISEFLSITGRPAATLTVDEFIKFSECFSNKANLGCNLSNIQNIACRDEKSEYGPDTALNSGVKNSDYKINNNDMTPLSKKEYIETEKNDELAMLKFLQSVKG